MIDTIKFGLGFVTGRPNVCKIINSTYERLINQFKSMEQKVELTESDNGFLQATIQESGTYILTYEKTMVMKIANIINVITGIVCIILLVKKKRKVYLLEKTTGNDEMEKFFIYIRI